MAHDRNGTLLKVGDVVNVPMRVSSVSPSAEFCNVTMETVLPPRGAMSMSCLTCNTGQVVLADNVGDVFDQAEAGVYAEAASQPGAKTVFGGGQLAGVIRGLAGKGVANWYAWIPVILQLLTVVGPKIREIVDLIRDAIGKGQTPNTFQMPTIG